MDNSDGLDIPDFLLVANRDKWEKRCGHRKNAKRRHRRKTAKDKRFHLYAMRKAARKRARFEWS